MTNGVWIADGELGSSVRAKLNNIPGKGNAEHLTSGASPITTDPNYNITYITTGGTGGNEDVVLGDFPLDGNGYNAGKNGVIHTVILETRTNPADSVRVFAGSVGDPLEAIDDTGVTIGKSDDNGGFMHTPGESVNFVWRSYGWFAALDNGANITTWEYKRYPFNDGSSDGQVPAWNDSTKQVEWRDAPGEPGTLLQDVSDQPITSPASVYAGLVRSIGPSIVITGTPFVASSTYQFSLIFNSADGEFSIDDDLLTLFFVGVRILFVQQSAGGHTATLTPLTKIKKADGTDPTSITFDTNGQFLLLENWDGTVWRIVRATCNVT